MSTNQGGTYGKPTGGSARRWVIGLVGLAVVVLLADAAWSTLGATRDLKGARDQLRLGGELLVAGDLPGAQAAFGQASSLARSADGYLGHPVPRLAGALPWVGDDVHAVEALSGAATDAAYAGLELTAAARSVGWDGETVPGFGAGGTIDAAGIADGAPALRAAASTLDEAQSILAEIDTDGLVGPVASAVERARAEFTERASVADTAADVAEVLPGFLGAGGPRSYLVVMQNLSDPRGAGGYPGSYGLIHVDGQRIELEEMEPASAIPAVSPIAAPADVVRLYGSFGATTDFIATTYSPDFPTDARLMLGIWEAAGYPPVDGVISGDAVLMSYLLEGLGPVDSPVLAPGWPASITAANAVEVINRDTFQTTSQRRSDDWQAAIGTALWGALLSRPPPPRALADAIARGAAERHFQVYSADPAQQETLAELGVAGEVSFSEDHPPLVVLQGFSDNRAGYFATTEVASSSSDMADGSTRVTVTVTLRNTAPTGPPSILLGTATSQARNGSFQAQLQVYLPDGAEVLKSTVDGGPGALQLVEEEFGRPMAIQFLETEAGTTTTATIVYRVPQA